MLADDGSRGAAIALRLAADPGAFLSSVQIGITLVGVLSGAFSGAILGGRLADALTAAASARRWCRRLGSAVWSSRSLPVADFRKAGSQADRAARAGGGSYKDRAAAE